MYFFFPLYFSNKKKWRDSFTGHKKCDRERTRDQEKKSNNINDDDDTSNNNNNELRVQWPGVCYSYYVIFHSSVSSFLHLYTYYVRLWASCVSVGYCWVVAFTCVCVLEHMCICSVHIFFVLFRTFTSSFLYLNPSFSFAMPILLSVWCAYVYVKIFLALGCMCVCSTYKIYLRQNAAQIYIHLMLHMERVNAENDKTRKPFVFFIIEMQL